MNTDQIIAHKAWYAAKFPEDLEFARTGMSPGLCRDAARSGTELRCRSRASCEGHHGVPACET